MQRYYKIYIFNCLFRFIYNMFNSTNASLVNNEVINNIHNNRMIHAKVYMKHYLKWNTRLDTNSLCRWSVWQYQYNPFDYGNINNSVLCELKTLRTSTLSNYSYIDLLTQHEYKAFTDALNKNPETLCFVFIYFSENNTLFWTRITTDTNLEQIVNKYGKQCYKINKDDFKEITLYKNYQLYLA